LGWTDESSWGNSQSSGTTAGSEKSWQASQTVEITCEAQMEVKPSHSVSYSLIFRAYTATIKTLTDLKLTMCSQLVHPESSSEATEDDVIYISGIPGVLTQQETTTCDVSFGPPTYVQNEMACDEEQKVAMSVGSTHIPRCQETDSTLYDGCQCDIGDTETLGVCWCSDENGNPLDGQMSQPFEGSYNEVCVSELACQNTTVEFIETTEAFTETTMEFVDESTTAEFVDESAEPTEDVFDFTWAPAMNAFWVGLVIFLTVAGVVCYAIPKIHREKYAAVRYLDSEAEEENAAMNA